MKILDIYSKYKVMPQLQTHMFRVAAVASIICDAMNKPVDKKNIVAACLLHDMGNMSKFKLDRFPEMLEPEGLEYWSKVQNEFIQKYGTDDYKATYAILDELGVSGKLYELAHAIEFGKAPENAKHDDIEKKICTYSDLRVTPFGIASLSERLVEVKDRYIKNKGVTEEYFDNLGENMAVIETQIFSHANIKPIEIIDQNVNEEIEELIDFEIL